MTARCVLVMDDDPGQRYICQRALNHAGYRVYPAATVQEARELLTKHHFVLFLCDILMDNGNCGTDLISEQSAELTKQGTQVIMMSSESQYRVVCKKMGLDWFMEKPVGVQSLTMLVDHLTAQQ